MSEHISEQYDQPIYVILYQKYKAYIVSCVILLICAALVYYVILPQYDDLQQTWAKEQVLRSKNKILADNVVLLKSLQDTSLDSKLETVTLALPAEKDYAGVLVGVPNTAAIARTAIGDFSFVVGDLNTTQKSKTEGVDADENNISVDLLLKGSEDATKLFLQTLSKVFPLAAADNLSLGSVDNVSLKTKFYAKLLPKFAYDDEKPLQPLTAKENALLEQLALWQNQNPDRNAVPAAPPAATPTVALVSPTVQVTPVISATPSGALVR